MSKEFYGYLSIALTCIAFTPYIFSIWRGTTKPHVFSWMIWGLLLLIGTAGQHAGHAGPGAWATGLSACLNMLVVVLALKTGDRNITRHDILAFCAALTALPLWYITDNPLSAIIVVSFIDMMGYVPTVRKAWDRPDEEMPLFFIICNIEYLASFSAMLTYSLTTLLYPTLIFMANFIVIGTIYWRRGTANPA